MAYALVGAAGTVATGLPTASPTFGQATTAGNLLVAWVVGDNGGGGFSVSGSGWLRATAASVDAAIYYKPNCGAGETAPTFTNNNAGLNTYAALAEFSGGDTVSPVDQVGSSATGVSGTNVCANAAADIALGELFLSSDGWFLSKAGTTTTTDTYNNGATPTTNRNNDATSIVTHYRFAWGVTTSAAAADQTTATSSSMNALNNRVVTASFKLAATTRFPRNPAINFVDPAVMAKAWQKKVGRIFVPDLWLPTPA